jgi:hypothetical protein
VDDDSRTRALLDEDRDVTKQLPGLDLLAQRQAQTVTRHQLAALGADRHLVERRERAGVWRTLGPRVVCLHQGDLGREQRWWAGYLHAGHDDGPATHRAALTRLTAAEAGGLVGFETETVHVVVEHGRQVGDLVVGPLHVIVHETRHLQPGEIHPTRHPPRIRLARAVVECASETAVGHPARARALIAAAVQQRLVRPDALRVVAAGRRTLPGRRLVLETIGDAQSGAHSLPEQEFLRGVRRAGLPEPQRQRALRRADGRWYLDNDFTDFLVTVEVNGLQHYEQTLRERDDFRRAVLQIGGRIVVDLSSYAVRHHIEECLLVTADALIAHGYRPPAETRLRLERMRSATGPGMATLRAS